MNDHQNGRRVAGYATWLPAGIEGGVAFVGRGGDRARDEVFGATTGLNLPISWLDQIHGCEVVEASIGCSGAADAVTTTRSGLAVAVSTADCVPIVLSRPDRVAAVHAGWRGIVAGIVGRAVEVFADRSESPRAWIGPAIGACCYEVGPDVAERVVDACQAPEVVSSPPGGPRPHVDLVQAVASQLRHHGVDHIGIVDACTYCRSELNSYRRDGSAGRNLAFAWLPSAA